MKPRKVPCDCEGCDAAMASAQAGRALLAMMLLCLISWGVFPKIWMLGVGGLAAMLLLLAFALVGATKDISCRKKIREW